MAMGYEEEKAYLLLEDGTLLEGRPFGARGKTSGTVVFNTGMVGYQQLLTDPANHGLLLVQTFPLIGNYGINSDDAESEKVQAAGYIVREHCAAPSNYKCEGTLEELLTSSGTVGICGIDTRHLTRLIRDRGEMRGMIVSEGPTEWDLLLEELQSEKTAGALAGLSPREGSAGGQKPAPCAEGCKVGVLDLGGSRSLYRALSENGMDCRVLRFDLPLADLVRLHEKEPFDGFVLTDGPEDFREMEALEETVRGMLGLGVPMLGVALGHQILAAAHDLGLLRMKCGHRGANQPVLSLLTGRTYITSQNHGYVVDRESVRPEIGDITFENANDHTVEGLVYRDGISFGVQFVPDGKPGRQSTVFIYEEFKQMMQDRKGKVE